MHRYGARPVEILDDYRPEWTEFMHYLYLPVRIPSHDNWPDESGPTQWCLPQPLEFADEAIRAAMNDAPRAATHLNDPYVYLSARCGYATPGNPLNRPGWHCDDFGGIDLNYIWTDAYPTRYLERLDPLYNGWFEVPEGDAESMYAMTRYAYAAEVGSTYGKVREIELNTLYRLDPYVIHDTPIIDKPGLRRFFKISLSTHRYDLVGNSRNYGLTYDWPMLDRDALRNQPVGGNKDHA